MKDNKYKFIEMREKTKDDNGRPIYWIMNRKSATILGTISYYNPWRQYVAQMNNRVVLSHDCLADIQDFMIRLKEYHKSPATR